jgi:hypothetical protein
LPQSPRICGIRYGLRRSLAMRSLSRPVGYRSSSTSSGEQAGTPRGRRTPVGSLGTTRKEAIVPPGFRAVVALPPEGNRRSLQGRPWTDPAIGGVLIQSAGGARLGGGGAAAQRIRLSEMGGGPGVRPALLPIGKRSAERGVQR